MSAKVLLDAVRAPRCGVGRRHTLRSPALNRARRLRTRQSRCRTGTGGFENEFVRVVRVRYRVLGRSSCACGLAVQNGQFSGCDASILRNAPAGISWTA